jgi:hypothetical protein
LRLFGIIVLAGLLSAGAALAITLAGLQILTCSSDPAGCGMAMAFQVLAIPVYAAVLTIIFGMVMLFANRLRAIAVTACILVGLTITLFILGLLSDVMSGRQTRASDFLELLQMLLPFWAAVVVQWFVIKYFLTRHMTATEGHAS